jgi:hypothetical protein
VHQRYHVTSLAGLFERRIQILVVPLEDVAIGVSGQHGPGRRRRAGRARQDLRLPHWHAIIIGPAERDPAAAARLAAARAAVTAIAGHSRLPIENLICPNTVRWLSWILLSRTLNRPWRKRWLTTDPGPWQIELTAGPIAGPLMAGDRTCRL